MPRGRKPKVETLEPVIAEAAVTTFAEAQPTASGLASYESRYTGEEIDESVGKAHGHSNKAVLDKFAETNGQPTFDGQPVVGTPGQDGADGKDATINGISAVEIIAGENITLRMDGDKLIINAESGLQFPPNDGNLYAFSNGKFVQITGGAAWIEGDI